MSDVPPSADFRCRVSASAVQGPRPAQYAPPPHWLWPKATPSQVLFPEKNRNEKLAVPSWRCEEPSASPDAVRRPCEQPSMHGSSGGLCAEDRDTGSAEHSTTRMSRRLNRRQQRELEELEELDAIKADVGEDSAPVSTADSGAPTLGFAAVCSTSTDAAPSRRRRGGRRRA